ncbi:MAG: DUF1559 domain-containing protein [Pirellulaceae bacterium]|nr:DUF1559 domain-containing protein [Pirellulaceae bacterium]
MATLRHPVATDDRRGMTLIELLVVVAISSTLVALLLPAVQAAREAARRAQCASQLKQLGTASLAHEQAHRFLPSGGWGHAWIGDPDLGFGREQPGGWAYHVLPYIEQSDVHGMGRKGTSANKKAAAIRLATTALGVFHCPSRRAVRLYPHDSVSTVPLNPHGLGGLMIERAELPSIARMCYGMNAGTTNLGHPGLPLTIDDAPVFTGWIDTSTCNGVNFQRSELRMSRITDGTSNTYLIGEKNVNPDCYTTFSKPGDSQSMFNGWDEDNVRYAGIDTRNNARREYPPTPDTPGVEAHQCFGGPHPGVCLFVFCDGSVRPIDYSVDLLLHHNMAARNDGAVLPADAFR